VLPVEMKTPGSITLSLGVMSAARQVVVAACGVSDKYPQGKSTGMKRAIEGDETVSSFPAVGLRQAATWIIDRAAASQLSKGYAR
jgi:6-phosphogluconolactonase